MLAWLTSACLRRPLATTAGILLLTALAAWQAAGVRTEFGYRPLVGATHPSIVTLESFIERYAGGFPVRVVWRCGDGVPCEAALDAASVAMAGDLDRRLSARPAVRSVRSPAEESILEPAPDGFRVRRLGEDVADAADRASLVARARRDPFWEGQLVSADGRTGAILVQPVDTESRTSVAVVEAIRAALAPWEAQGWRFHLVGHAVEFVVAGRELAESTAALTPITALAVGVLLFLLTRSWQVVVAAMAAMGTALVWTFGFLGALGWPQDSILQVLAPLILVTGICDAVHLVGQRSPPSGSGRAERSRALVRAASRVAGPCAVTTWTTGAAFLSFATSDLATFVRFGVVSAFGVGMCLVLTFAWLPVLLWWLPAERVSPSGASAAGSWDAALAAVAAVADRRRVGVLAVAGLVMLVCGVGWATRLRVDTDGYEMYGDQSQVIRWIRFVERHLSRADHLELDIAFPPGVHLADPAVLATLDRTGRALERIEGLGPARSIVDAVARLREVLPSRDGPARREGASLEANAELIELLGFEDPDFLESWVGFDRRHARVSVEAEFQSFAVRDGTLGHVDRELARALPADWKVATTGPFAMGRDWVRDVQATQLRSFATAFALVLLLLWGYLRSLRWAVLGLLPTLLPVVAILGAMGWFGLSLDVGRSMIAAVVLGIGIDDTIHLLARFRRERQGGRLPCDAIARAVRGVGRPVVTTSLALGIGFLALTASSWQTVSSFGLFVSLGIVGALVGDLVVLPALVIVAERRS